MIRKMQESDSARVMDIWLTSTIKAHPFVKQNYWIKHYRTVKNKYLKVATTYVIEEADSVVGFISILNDDFIGALFVIPGCQGKGYGTKLLSFAQETYPNLRAYAYVKNDRALHFYKKHGFVVTDRQKNLDSQFEEDILDWSKDGIATH